MKNVTTFLAIAAMATQLAAPAFAGDITTELFNSSVFNGTTALGWRQTTGPAAMAYFRMPLTATTHGLAPQMGLMVAGPQAYAGGEAHLHLDGPRVLDIGITGRNLSEPWRADSWTSALTLGNTTAWSSDGVPAGQNPHLFDSGTSWVVVGVLTVGAVAAGFALADRKR